GAAAAAAWVPPQLTVVEWLRQHGQPSSLCEWLWYPLAYASLNQDPAVAAAQPYVRVVAELFGSTPGASSIGLPSVPLDELYAEPAARYIEAHGGSVRRKVGARVDLAPARGHHRVSVGEQVLSASAVISAVPWYAIARLWTGPIPARLAAIVDSATRLESAPIVTVYLWFDRPIMSERQIGLVGTAFHWVFRKDVDTRRLFLVTLVASGAEGLLRQSNEELAALAERDLRACLRGAAGASCLRSLVVREARATFSLAPDAPERPPAATPVPGFFLAGDWTATGLPGTIESGVMSGHLAADAAMIVL
ncbi:MAG: FAD-dependent oxidoreductase, partial [Vicinamibacterales bacterium]